MCTKTPEIMAGRMLRYLKTWHADNGAIHGVHTHPVWRIHPGLLEDHYTGYSAWGAPYLIGLADALKLTGGDAAIRELTLGFVDYVLTTQMENQRWDNAGAEFGRCFNASTVDNMLQDLSLGYFARVARPYIGEARFKDIGERVRRNLDSYLKPEEHIRKYGWLFEGTTNQDCAGVWACFEWMETYGRDARLEHLIRLALDAHLDRHMVENIPEPGCAGMSRDQDKDKTDYVEPAEYYGVIIPAYLYAAKWFSDERYLNAAWAMARHVIQASWVDDNGCRRLHRSTDLIHGKWVLSHSPMLISGGGLFARVLSEMAADGSAQPRPPLEPWNRHEGRGCAEPFLADMLKTYSHYQNPYGMVAQASGWHDDFDIIAGTVWQCHDLPYLVQQSRDPAAFLQAFREPSPDLAMIIGWNDAWVENATQWSILRPYSFGFGSVGSKTATHGYPALPAWTGYKHKEMMLKPEVEVRLIDDVFVLRAKGYENIAVTSIYGKRWEREI